ncbi:hydroxyisourate hydrolase [Nocardioides sp. 1609]|uniref:hydroxyisourate hydrolase n=1 Tax=Nocardioides sp. 1609 TaxID=2508327 RepID=UPI00106FD97F|nr:hydroxyisourate hydrolase [Nocardioides sp. 1609]
MSTLSTHVLDAALGDPAADLGVTLHRVGDPTGDRLAEAVTDDDGRVGFDVDLAGGVHELRFATGPWFAAAHRDTFFPEVTVAFEVEAGRAHHHVALLLSPYSYTTYRGS